MLGTRVISEHAYACLTVACDKSDLQLLVVLLFSGDVLMYSKSLPCLRLHLSANNRRRLSKNSP